MACRQQGRQSRQRPDPPGPELSGRGGGPVQRASGSPCRPGLSFENRSSRIQQKTKHEPSHPQKDSGQLLSGFKQGLCSPWGKKISPPCRPAWSDVSEAAHSESEFWPLWCFSSVVVSVFFFFFLSVFKVLNRKSELGLPLLPPSFT